MSKILIVDDSVTVRNEVSNFLEQHDLQVETAVDGFDAFDKLRHDQSFSLAIVDVNMPNLDGLSFIEKVQSETSLKLNIIMLTTEFESNLKERGKRAGVKGWIVKPFNGEKVIGYIKQMLS